MRGKRLIALTMAAVLAVLVLLASATAKPGRVILPAGDDAIATDVAAQRDGKVVVAGFSNVEGNGSVWRLKENGRLDGSFGENGIATVDSGGSERLFAVAIQPDGKILVAGSTNTGGGNGAVYRLRKNGTPDTSFDTDGALGIDSAGFEELSDIALRPGGKILVVGATTVSDDAALYQVKENGGNGTLNDGLDDSFAGDGAFGLDLGGTELGFGLAVQRDGKVVVVGATDVGDRAVAWRVKADGSGLDPGFGDAGTVLLPSSGVGALAFEVAVQRDRKIAVVGTSGGQGDADGVVWRLKRGGGLDGKFAGDGSRVIHFGSGDDGKDLQLVRRGRILVTGTTVHGSEIDAFVAKLTERGSFDKDFKANGKRVIRGPKDELGEAIAVDRDGRILVSGSTLDTGDALVFRLRKNGATDKNFGP